MGRAHLLGRVVAVLLVLSLVLPAAVLADDLTGAGDYVFDGLIDLDLGDVTAGDSADGTAVLHVGRENDGSVFDDGSSIAVSFSGEVLPTSLASVVTSVVCADDAIVLPANWSSTRSGTLSADSASCTVSISTAGLALGAYSLKVGMDADGTRTMDGVSYPLKRAADLVVTFAVVEGQEPEPAYTISGFYAPVKEGFNVVKGGRVVPLKFEVFKDGVELTDVNEVILGVSPVNCADSALVSDISVVLDTDSGSTLLRYDEAQGMFIKNWKAPVTAGVCYEVTVTVGEASTSADFRVK